MNYTFYYNNKKLVWSLAGCTFLLVLALCGVYTFYYQDQYQQLSYIPLFLNKSCIPVCRGISISLFNFCVFAALVQFVLLVLFSVKLLIKKPAVIISTSGIIVGNYPLILWSDIAEIKTVMVHSEKCIGIVLHHPKKYLFQGRFYRSLLEKMNFYLTLTHIQINPHVVGISQGDLYTLMQQMFNTYK